MLCKFQNDLKLGTSISIRTAELLGKKPTQPTQPNPHTPVSSGDHFLCLVFYDIVLLNDSPLSAVIYPYVYDE